MNQPMSCSQLFLPNFLHTCVLLVCAQLKDPINPEDPDPAKRDPVKTNVGCTEWCKESMRTGWGDQKPSKHVPNQMGMQCSADFFRSTAEEYTQLLSDRKRGLKSDQQIREILLKRSSTENRHCAEGLYCATVSTPGIETILATQQYDFATGALRCRFLSCDSHLLFGVHVKRQIKTSIFVMCLHSGRCEKCERCKELAIDDCSEQCPNVTMTNDKLSSSIGAFLQVGLPGIVTKDNFCSYPPSTYFFPTAWHRKFLRPPLPRWW